MMYLLSDTLGRVEPVWDCHRPSVNYQITAFQVFQLCDDILII